MVLYTTGLAITAIVLLFALLVTLLRCSKRKIDIAVLEKSRLDLGKKIEWLEAELDRVISERNESTTIFLNKIATMEAKLKHNDDVMNDRKSHYRNSSKTNRRSK